MNLRSLSLAVAATALLSGHALADDAKCKTIRMSDPGWTDITSTNAIATTLLKGLGYETDIKTLSVLVGYQSMGNKDIDVFLGNWMPAQQKFIDELNAKKAAEVLVQNLEGAKFTLAVPTYVSDKGIKDFKDLAKNADSFGKQIYGIEPGAPANENMQKMIDSGDFGLKGWSVVESSEAGMLIEAQRAIKADKAIVFLGWEPHPMNVQMKMSYLSGGDDVFGPNLGEAKVYTAIPPSYEKKCPNVNAFLKNLQFTTDMENQVMGPILKKVKPNKAARDFLAKNPATVDKWLAGVTTLDGKPGAEAVKAALAK